jgi:hypothetical protein
MGSQPDRFGKELVLSGLGLVGAFFLVLFLTRGSTRSPLWDALTSAWTALLVFAGSTLLALNGTVRLFRRVPTGTVTLTDVAFVVVGVLATAFGVCGSFLFARFAIAGW